MGSEQASVVFAIFRPLAPLCSFCRAPSTYLSSSPPRREGALFLFIPPSLAAQTSLARDCPRSAYAFPCPSSSAFCWHIIRKHEGARFPLRRGNGRRGVGYALVTVQRAAACYARQTRPESYLLETANTPFHLCMRAPLANPNLYADVAT